MPEFARIVCVCIASSLTWAISIGNVSAATQVTLYVALEGDDANSGRSPQSPFRSLDAVQRHVASLPASEDPLEVAVLFQPGHYRDQAVEWTVARPNLVVVFRPIPQAPGGSVTFDGAKVNKRQFFKFDPASTNSKHAAESVEFAFENISIENFCEGISLGNVRGDVPSSGHRISGVTLRAIGSKYDRRVRANARGERLPLGDCVAGIRLSATSDTTIKNTRFEDIENSPSSRTFYRKYGPGLLHAVYISTESRNNSIVDSVFSGFTGSPVRIRDRSDGTQVLRNLFERPIWPDGKVEERPLYAISQWYCNVAVSVCMEMARRGNIECPSSGISMEGNRLGSGVLLYADESQSKDSTCMLGSMDRHAKEPQSRHREVEPGMQR